MRLYGISLRSVLVLMAAGCVVMFAFALMEGASLPVAVAVSPAGSIAFLGSWIVHNRLDHFCKHGRDAPFLEYEDRGDV